jgi:hypothetical protein
MVKHAHTSEAASADRDSASKKPTSPRTENRKAGQQVPAKTATRLDLPQDIAEFVGERPIVKGEDPQQYDILLDKLAAFIAPTDPIEWIWTKDIADALWEGRRARRMRDQILDIGRYKAMRRLAENLLQEKRCVPGFQKLVDKTVSAWMGPGGDEEVAHFLARHGLDPLAVASEAFMNRCQPYELLERIAASADKRRDALLRDIERHRAGRAKHFREAASVVDAEAEEVTSRSSPDPTASKDLAQANDQQ